MDLFREANYATRIYLCNPCKPWNRPYRPNPMNCLIRQQPLKTNPLRTSHVSAGLGCKPGRNRQSRTMNRVNSAFFRLWFPQLSAEVTANCAPRVSRAFFIFIFKKNKISKIYVEQRNFQKWVPVAPLMGDRVPVGDMTFTFRSWRPGRIKQ